MVAAGFDVAFAISRRGAGMLLTKNPGMKAGALIPRRTSGRNDQPIVSIGVFEENVTLGFCPKVRELRQRLRLI
jgi:hypothetical protein